MHVQVDSQSAIFVKRGPAGTDGRGVSKVIHVLERKMSDRVHVQDPGEAEAGLVEAKFRVIGFTEVTECARMRERRRRRWWRRACGCARPPRSPRATQRSWWRPARCSSRAQSAAWPLPPPLLPPRVRVTLRAALDVECVFLITQFCNINVLTSYHNKRCRDSSSKKLTSPALAMYGRKNLK